MFQDKAVTKNSLIIPAVLVGGRKKKHTEGRNVYMGVRVVIPNMSKTFGALHYAGEGEAVTWNIYGEDVKGNFYTFFADALRIRLSLVKRSFWKIQALLQEVMRRGATE